MRADWVHQSLREARLYGIVDLGYVAPERSEAVARELLAGGVHVLQLRAKNYDESSILELAVPLVPLCAGSRVPFIVNDHVEVARRAGAHGVHLGQDDGSLREARDRLPPGAVVGRSTHGRAQAEAAREEGADYIGFGPLFPTPTKEGRPAIGLEEVAGVQGSVGAELPVFCIGGIKPGNLGAVLAAGARRVVIVSDLLTAPDVPARCGEVLDVLQRHP